MAANDGRRPCPAVQHTGRCGSNRWSMPHAECRTRRNVSPRRGKAPGRLPGRSHASSRKPRRPAGHRLPGLQRRHCLRWRPGAGARESIRCLRNFLPLIARRAGPGLALVDRRHQALQIVGDRTVASRETASPRDDASGQATPGSSGQPPAVPPQACLHASPLQAGTRHSHPCPSPAWSSAITQPRDVIADGIHAHLHHGTDALGTDGRYSAQTPAMRHQPARPGHHCLDVSPPIINSSRNSACLKGMVMIDMSRYRRFYRQKTHSFLARVCVASDQHQSLSRIAQPVVPRASRSALNTNTISLLIGSHDQPHHSAPDRPAG